LAPERWLEPLVRERVRDVFTADLERGDVNFQANLEHLPIPDASLDVLICSDVLEHVEDDAQAMGEIRRVLKDDGVAYIHVPIVARQTVEYGFPVEIDHGHRRAYGPDVKDRLAGAGLRVTEFASVQLSAGLRRRWGVVDNDRVLLGSPKRSVLETQSER
ncbi:MAG: class I SAM-dependent methyltransferase, partial [Actinomycetota bacterium]